MRCSPVTQGEKYWGEALLLRDKNMGEKPCDLGTEILGEDLLPRDRNFEESPVIMVEKL